jgi:hypothetical protein
MKLIRIPKEALISISLKAGIPRKVVLADLPHDDLAAIEKNGAEIISSAIMLERRMVASIASILFERSEETNTKKEFFTGEILETSDFSFAFKRRVFTRLLEQFQLVEPETIKSLKAGLNKVMLWRNAFAHGQIVTDLDGRFVLSFYSGGHQDLDLTDEFFEKVESTIRSCLYTCNGIVFSEVGET